MVYNKAVIHKIRIVLVLISIFSINLSYSQVTIGKDESIVKTITTKPEPLDSLKDWGEGIDRMSDYKKYIGADIYMPPYREDHVLRNETFFFTMKPSLIVLDTNKTDYHGRKVLPSFFLINRREGRNVSIFVNKVKTNVYKPKLISSSTVTLEHTGRSMDGEILLYRDGEFRIDLRHDEDIFNNYYTIIDVLYAKSLDSINSEVKNQHEIAQNKFEIDFKEMKSNMSNMSFEEIRKIIEDEDLNIVDNGIYPINFDNDELVFKMLNKKNGDTVFCLKNTRNMKIRDFVLVPYFVKHKEIYEGKNLIYDDLKGDYGSYMYHNKTKEDYIQKIEYENDDGEMVKKGVEVPLQRGSKWKCEEVTLLLNVKEIGPPSYNIHFILSNDKGQTIALTKGGLYGFILEEDYIERNKLQKLSEAEKKENEAQKIRRLKEAQKEKHKILEGKYGKENADLIINHKVDLNMTKEMCVASWGKPYNTSLLMDANMKIETFYYTGGYILHFENNKLIRIIK